MDLNNQKRLVQTLVAGTIKEMGHFAPGIKLSRLVTINFNFSQNFSSVVSGTGVEQEDYDKRLYYI